MKRDLWLAEEERKVALEALRYWVYVRTEQGVTGGAVDLPRALADRIEASLR